MKVLLEKQEAPAGPAAGTPVVCPSSLPACPQVRVLEILARTSSVLRDLVSLYDQRRLRPIQPARMEEPVTYPAPTIREPRPRQTPACTLTHHVMTALDP